MSKRKAKKEIKDFAIVGGPTEDGRGAHLLRVRNGNVMAGEIRPVREGEPITHNELVRLHPIDAEPRICEIEVLHSPEAATDSPAEEASSDERDDDGARDVQAARDGEAKRRARVTTERYRKNWSAIFEAKGKKRSKTDWTLN